MYDFCQRGRRGYARSDVWNLSDYLCGWLPGALLQLMDEGVSTPTDLSEKEWCMVLSEIADGFDAQRELSEGTPAPAEIERLRERWQRGGELFVERFGALWD